MIALLEVISNIQQPLTKKQTVNPKKLFDWLSFKWPLYKGYAQQDAHELLRRLLDSINDEQLRRYPPALKISKRPSTFIEDLFQGQLVSIIVCDINKHVSFNYEPFMDLSLSILKPSKSIRKYISDLMPSRSRASSRERNNTPSVASTSSADIERLTLKFSAATLESKTLISNLLRPVANDEGREVSIMQCLEDFMKVETLEEDNLWACDACYKEKYGHDVSVACNELCGGAAVNVKSDSDGDVNEDEVVTKIHSEMGAMYESTSIEDDEKGNNYQGVQEVSCPEIQFHAASPLEDKTDSSDTSDSASEEDLSESSFRSRSQPLPESSQRKIQRAHQPIYSRAYKRYLIHDSPPTLVLHLKRFQTMIRTTKCNDHVAFSEYISIDELMSPPTTPNKPGRGGNYRIFGVIVHSGGLTSGHYTAHVRHGEEWFYCSDAHTIATTWDHVAKAQAYVVLYKREN